MSRIQEILAKAEREGTARRPQPTAVPAPPPVAPPTAVSLATAPASSTHQFDGTAALAPAVEEVRTVTATLHPALVAALNPHSDAAEQYRSVRTRLAQHEGHAPMRTIAVTSPGEGDGKSVTAANLALTMAQEIQTTVVLVDTELRTPAAHALLGVAGTPGLAEVLSGEATLDEALLYLPELRLTLLPAGATPQFPTELLGSNAMRRTLDTLRSRFDRIVLDVPAVAPLADAGTVGPLADGVLMVVRAGVTKRPALDQALGAFPDGHVVGVILNESR
ncbi:MAG: CpsD/CapB family tyrosine-protein kinase [Vicinamibacterales bacterium]